MVTRPEPDKTETKLGSMAGLIGFRVLKCINSVKSGLIRSGAVLENEI